METRLGTEELNVGVVTYMKSGVNQDIIYQNIKICQYLSKQGETPHLLADMLFMNTIYNRKTYTLKTHILHKGCSKVMHCMNSNSSELISVK